ncbi:hypothetical protein PR048_005372 [Dryococelus australis]|uniref:Uncharacterized protein n=1 Tax=Dryococelus australis TaxID=614101 RepID=A0ABQ9I8Y9_9NEOP|nr:hypothetical protein PR048_005372 [Dryococelus australis]
MLLMLGKSLSTYHNPALEIVNQIHLQRMAQVEENKQRLISIVKTIILCGKQNITLRGRKDDRNIYSLLNGDEKHSIIYNYGNFRDLLRFRKHADLKLCVGFGVDSCSVMASGRKGAIQELKNKTTHTQHCPCSNHILNNSLANSSIVVSCRKASGTTKKIIYFFLKPLQRDMVFLKGEIEASVQGICETYRVERHEGHLHFLGELIIKIHNALAEISTW